MDLARPSSLRPVVLGLCLAGCATTSTVGDRGAVEAEVQDRLKLKGLQLPDPSDATELPAELEPLLAQPLTPDSAARVALLANRSARAALAELGIARGDFVQAGVLPNPHAELDLRAPGGPQPAQLDLGLDLQLTAMVLAPLKQGVAESRLEAAKWQAAGKLLELGYRARLSCLALQGALAREVLRRQALAALEASAATAQELHRVGNLPPRELSTQRAAVEFARLQQLEAKAAVAQAREAFIRALGLPAGKSRFEVAALPERLPPPLPADAAEGAAVAQSLELKAGLELAESASRALTLSQTQGYLPEITAGFHGQRDGTFWELGGHVAVSLPSFDRGQGRSLGAQSTLDLKRAQGMAARLRIASQARAAAMRLDGALERSKLAREQLVPAREQALAEALAEYNAMALGVFELLGAHRALTEAQLVATDATLEAWRADAALSLLVAGWSAEAPEDFAPRETTAVGEPLGAGGH